MSARFPGLATTCDASSWVRISTEGTDSSTSWPTICRRLGAARPPAMFAISATASRSMSEICITCPAASLRDLPEPQHVRALAPEIGRQDETAISRHVQIDQRDVHVLGLHRRNGLVRTAAFDARPVPAYLGQRLGSHDSRQFVVISDKDRPLHVSYLRIRSLLDVPSGSPERNFPARWNQDDMCALTSFRRLSGGPSGGPDVGPSPHDPSAHAPSNSSLAAIKAILRLGMCSAARAPAHQAAASTVTLIPSKAGSTWAGSRALSSA